MSGAAFNHSAAAVACQAAARIAAHCEAGRTLIVGINGAQGSGKSTLAALIAEALEAEGKRTLALALDDFYLTAAEREELANTVHRLCRTRGVPGTHDMALLGQVLDRLAAGEATALPRFDKLADDRAAESGAFTGRPDVILLEGWCVGIRAADLPPYDGPINALEATADPDGAWLGWSLAVLERDYKPVWERFDLLVSIAVPDLETVIASRLAQEQGLEAASGRKGMDLAGVVRFVQHYERYTRAGWAAIPARADLPIRRDAAFNFEIVGE